MDVDRANSKMKFDGLAFAKSLQHTPGVYRMLDASGGLLYVGKAKSLRRRVESYFARPILHPRLATMVAQVASMEVMVTRTEAEALLLESQQIKSLKPKYNIDLRDDKSYPFIRISKDDEYPRIAYYRGNRQLPGEYFGPFPSTWAVKETIESLQKLFQIRGCEDTVFAHRTRPCLQHQIKRCSAPCVRLIEPQAYRQQIDLATMFLRGKSQTVIQQIGAQMEQAAGALQFERAAALRDQITALRRVTANHFIAGERGDLDAVAVKLEQNLACVVVLFFRSGLNLGSKSFFPKIPTEADAPELLASFLVQFYTDQPAPDEILVSHALEDADVIAEALTQSAGHKVSIVSAPRAERAQLVAMAERTAATSLMTHLAAKSTLDARFEALRVLLDLPALPERIECFDISHTMGESTVASCVVFGPNGPIKNEYRKFNISGIEPGDDYAAMRQALLRRYKRIADAEVKKPDLLLIDGGKGQLQQALSVLEELQVTDLCVLGVAKGPARKSGFETLFVGAAMREIWPGPDSLGGHLIQQVRDEAHRFAITGHRKLRAKTRQKSVLEEIDGIGPTRRRAILKAFGGLRGVAKAGVEELCTVGGINAELALRIYDAFRGTRGQ
jgi:excinuclease ABC subunit C